MANAISGPAEGRTAEAEFLPASESPLLELLARATRELRIREAHGRPVEAVRGVVRSLRETLAWTTEHGREADAQSADLVVVIGAGGVAELWRRGTKIPVKNRHLRDALEDAGVAPEPGLVLLADPVLAGGAMEESLRRPDRPCRRVEGA